MHKPNIISSAIIGEQGLCNLFDPNLVLCNSIVRLRAIEEKDVMELSNFILDTDIWKYFAIKMETSNDMTGYVQDALKQLKLGLRQTFVIENIETNKIIGSTAFGNYSSNDKRIEIGWSWLETASQGTGINKNTKFLLLKYGFDHLGLERIEFKTDVLNHKARKALIKIGASEEGVLRSHTLMPGNRRRDTIYYSILRSEWPILLNNIFMKSE